MKKTILQFVFVLICFVSYSQNTIINDNTFANNNIKPDETFFLKQVEIKEHLLQQETKQGYFVRANAQDSLALVALYNSTTGANWTHKWNLNQPVSTWYGVILEQNGRVRVLDLYQNYLNGYIPSEIGNLTNLQGIDFSNNHLTGNIPIEVGNLTNLQWLYLNNNQLIGSIPLEIGNLINLQVIYLHYNNLSGSIPLQIGSLVNLQLLYLNNNQLTGSIPAEIGNLNSLQQLYLHYNLLNGTIPSEIGNLTNLTKLYLTNNQLSGSIPLLICSLTNLQELYLSNNLLSGSIPTEIGNLTNLQKIDFGMNLLSGSIPSSIGYLTNLKTLYLWNNQFTGSIPAEIVNLTNLQWFYFGGNKITILPDMSALTKLDYCYLKFNNLDFGDLQTANISASNYYYAPQDSILRTVVVNGSNVTITALCNGSGNQYQWYKDGQEISAEINSSITVSTFENAIYVCKVTNTQFDDLTLWSKAYNPLFPTKIEELKTQLEIYPNIMSESINFTSKVDNYTVYTFNGIETLNGTNTNMINISNLPAGVYLLKYNYRGTQQVQKFIKQ